jgi:hypothetical protein
MQTRSAQGSDSGNGSQSDSSHFTPDFSPITTRILQYKHARINTTLSKLFARFRFDHHDHHH